MSAKVVLLDAVSTVIQTHPSVVTVYQQHGRKFGSALDEAEVKQRFKAARRKLFAVDTSAMDQVEGELTSSDSIERDLWRRFIDYVFVDVADGSNGSKLFDELWEFFAVPENWRIYPDVAECLSELKRQGYYIAIASNFDSRLIPIVRAFPELSQLDDVFCSASIGFRKPDPAFYSQVHRQLERSIGAEVAAEDIVFSGDCIQNDFHGPRRQGWTAFWLDRSGEPESTADCPLECQISSLDQLSAALRR